MPDCLFCGMIEKKVKAKIEFENEDTLAIHDIRPQAPVHILVIPKKHIEKISDLTEKDVPLMGRLIDQARQIAAKRGWADYRFVFNNGPLAGQTISHIHLHLLSGRPMAWPPG